ncbi:MAG: hypothetical protein QG577_627, partial [Thermodesulfobacteriota bacterium]|nr:hypothetical protein [Thermodesulfobacteriota bacterium]
MMTIERHIRCRRPEINTMYPKIEPANGWLHESESRALAFKDNRCHT